MLTDEQLAELEKCRVEATPGPWKTDAFDARSVVVGDGWTVAEGAPGTEGGIGQIKANAAYIAAANPELVGKLIAEVKASRAATTEGLSVAAEFFEAMDVSGDREPLTPSAIACLLREYAADRWKRVDGAENP